MVFQTNRLTNCSKPNNRGPTPVERQLPSALGFSLPDRESKFSVAQNELTST